MPRNPIIIEAPLSAPVEEKPPACRGLLRAAELLVLAHEMDDLIDTNVVADRTHMATVAGFTTARISQIMMLVFLAPDIQEEVLFSTKPEKGRDWVSAETLIDIARLLSWEEQRKRIRQLPRRPLPIGAGGAQPAFQAEVYTRGSAGARRGRSASPP
ncbi:hypothetical protein LZC95_49990 [Pendulispora brunnea]|uniref:Uncharacterized protein n=1 Tax=Pendulispora brunnea TaxID=2905690 RepID=A0ABZ2KAY2_9BACT